MKLDQLNKLLSAKRPGAVAHIPENIRWNGTSQRRVVVSVTYTPGGKSYEYKGYIYEIAERLGLIEQRDMNTIAQRVARSLQTQESVTDHAGASDTLRALHGVDVRCDEAGTDEYGRRLVAYRRYDYAVAGWSTARVELGRLALEAARRGE